MPLQKTYPQNKHKLPNMHREKLPKLQTCHQRNTQNLLHKAKRIPQGTNKLPRIDEEPIEYKLFKRI